VNDAAIISAWLFGIFSGSLIAIGVASVVTARMLFNPIRLDWSTGEARALGAVMAGEGLAIGLLVLVFMLRWTAYEPIQPPPLFLFLLLTTAGFIGISFVGRHHNRRNPLKRW